MARFHFIVAEDRSEGRNVHIYDANDPTTVLGGLVLTDGVTNSNFYTMVQVFIMFDSEYVLRHQDGMVIMRDERALRPGNYYIKTSNPVAISIEPWFLQTMSIASGTGVEEFRDAVRQRDQRCAITGESAVVSTPWLGFNAAHIFPLAYEDHWNQYDYGRWITIHPKIGESINSVQNGLLLRKDIHALFDSYIVSINPDDNYKVVCFDVDTNGIAGKYIEFGNDDRRPVDQLLRWHFRQAVLANMRGAGEPLFETDFPSGMDIMGEIMGSPRAAERMEFELFSRLA